MISHENLAQGRWREMSFFEQMANIGAEVGRTFKWKEKGREELSQRSFERALELIDLTIKTAQKPSAVKELSRLREHFCEMFLDLTQYSCLDKYFYYFTVKR
ncbi:MAG: hypothetical protein PHX18_08155 [Candidatus Gastranaerophilales bacterium]|nr:hypothetical protein [Candidatus Gastranaerophilales bacterium]